MNPRSAVKIPREVSGLQSTQQGETKPREKSGLRTRQGDGRPTVAHGRPTVRRRRLGLDFGVERGGGDGSIVVQWC